MAHPVYEFSKGCCDTCQSWAASLRCSQCMKTAYCNAECQNKGWKQHEKVCKKPDSARLEYAAALRDTTEAIPTLLGLFEYMTKMRTEPGNVYLQTIIRIACILNNITTVKDSADVKLIKFCFDNRSVHCEADTTNGQRRTVLQLTSMQVGPGHGAGVSCLSGTQLAQRAAMDTRLRSVIGVDGDLTCGHIPLIFALSKEGLEHKQLCKKPDAARVEYIALVHETVDSIPPLLGLSEYISSPATNSGNAYLQTLIRIACIWNNIATVEDSAKILATDFRFDYRPRRCGADPSGQWHTLLNLTSVRSLSQKSTPFVTAPDTVAWRARMDKGLQASTGVYDDPTCCHIALLFGSQKSKDTKDRTSYVKFFWVPVLPGVARSAVKEMEESGMGRDDYTGLLFAKFNDMIIHDKVRGAPHQHASVAREGPQGAALKFPL